QGRDEVRGVRRDDVVGTHGVQYPVPRAPDRRTGRDRQGESVLDVVRTQLGLTTQVELGQRQRVRGDRRAHLTHLLGTRPQLASQGRRDQGGGGLTEVGRHHRPVPHQEL